MWWLLGSAGWRARCASWCEKTGNLVDTSRRRTSGTVPLALAPTTTWLLLLLLKPCLHPTTGPSPASASSRCVLAPSHLAPPRRPHSLTSAPLAARRPRSRTLHRPCVHPCVPPARSCADSLPPTVILADFGADVVRVDRHGDSFNTDTLTRCVSPSLVPSKAERTADPKPGPAGARSPSPSRSSRPTASRSSRRSSARPRSARHPHSLDPQNGAPTSSSTRSARASSSDSGSTRRTSSRPILGSSSRA